MFGIRKLVVGAGAAALFATAALLLLAQTGVAATRSFDDRPATSQGTLSPACTSAIQAINDAVVADRSEDAAERAVAKTEGADAADQTEDAAERAKFISLFKVARTACAPATVTRPVERTFTPTPACTSAIQAVKAFWAQGRPTTMAQWQQLQSLVQAAHAACGFTTSASWSWDRR